jgi:hypothetical protein
VKNPFRHAFTFLLILSCLIIVPACNIRDTLKTEETTIPVITASKPTSTTTAPPTTTTTTASTASTTGSSLVTTTKKPSTASTTKKPTTPGTLPNASDKVSFPNTLFIGDSRTVGLRDYGKLSDATFFCNVGLNAYRVWSESLDVSGVGKVTLEQLLEKKQFERVYVMLGINELGYNPATTAKKYEGIVSGIHAKQPNAKVIINSTLHVTKACNDITEGSKAIFTNKRINDFNDRIAALANNVNVFYLDLNPAFDDANGHMTSEYAAGDGIHIKAKYYLLWRDYLDKHRIG